jgi:hypothetical protein
MAKKALVHIGEPAGENDAGYRVLEVVDAGNEFDVHSALEWKDCGDSVDGPDLYWFDPSNNTFRKLPNAVDQATAGDLATDDDGNHTEKYVWNWTTETWSKASI